MRILDNVGAVGFAADILKYRLADGHFCFPMVDEAVSWSCSRVELAGVQGEAKLPVPMS